MANILVVAEHAGGQLKKGTLAVIEFARQAASRLGCGYDLLVAGVDVGKVASEAALFGAGKVLVVDSPALASYTAPAFAAVIAEVAGRGAAPVVAAAASTFGKDCLPRVAVRLKAGMASDIVGIGDRAGLTYLRPMWAGNLIGEVEVTTAVHVVTVRTAEFDLAGKSGQSSPVEAVAIAAPSASGQRVVEFRATVSARPDLAEAGRVVAGGRGVKSRENFGIIYGLADTLGAAVGATRAAVDAEFIENDYQIGQTGKIIAPDLYIGVGLSGAIQHLAGMKNSKVIVAINKDEEAPIFSVADYGLVGDLFKVVPELTEKLKARKGQ